MTEEQQQSLCALIRKLGAQAQALRNAGLQVDKKARQDFVSHADLFVEKEIKNWLSSHCPQDGFLGKRAACRPVNRAPGCSILSMEPPIIFREWITGASHWLMFARMKLIWGLSTLRIVMNFSLPVAARAFLNDKRLTLREPDPETVIIGMGRSSRAPVENYTRTIARVINAGMEYRRFGAGALMLAHVATGQVHAYYEEHMNSWDALAGMLIIVEAGGVSNAFLADDGLLNGNLVLAGCVDVQARLSALLVSH
jgi:myo-inositol-1(or 4)-monophosphatase